MGDICVNCSNELSFNPIETDLIVLNSLTKTGGWMELDQDFVRLKIYSLTVVYNKGLKDNSAECYLNEFCTKI